MTFPSRENFIWGISKTPVDVSSLGIIVERETAALPQTASQNLFLVSDGPVLLLSILGEVTTAIGNVANNTLLAVGAAGATNICAVANVQAAAIGTRYSITGTFGNAMVATAVGVPVAEQATAVVVPAGQPILVNCAASDGGGGRVKWTMIYAPLTEGATVTAV